MGLILILAALFLPLPEARGDIVEITLYGRDVPTPGWSLTPGSETDPGPTLQVKLGDEVHLRLIGEDGLPHVFYIDYDGDGQSDPGFEPVSLDFTTETMLVFPADQAGSFTYWCAVHQFPQGHMFGEWITSRPPQVDLVQPAGGTSWTGGTTHDITFSLTDADAPQNTSVWVNYTYAGGIETGAVAGPIAGTANPNVIPWTLPLIDASDVVLNLTAVDSLGARTATLSAPFEIDSTPPSIEARSPAPNAMGVARNARVEVRWSEGMSESASENPASFGVQNTPDGTWVEGSVTWDADSRTITFDPAELLAAETSFEVHVNASATDDSQPGNALTGAVSWTFRTSGVVDLDGPSINGLEASPSVTQPGEIVSIGATITDPSGVTEAWVLVEGSDLTLNLTLVQFGSQWFLNRSWEAAGTYQIEIGARDGVGNVNTAGGSFQVQETLGSTIGLVVLLGTLAALGAGGIVYLWIRRKPARKG